MNLAQKLQQCPPVTDRRPKRLETRALLKAAAPIDTDDPVDGILVEAGCTLGVVMTALEAMGADAHEGEASDVFTLLLALQRRLVVARKLRADGSAPNAAQHDEDQDEPAPASSSRPASPVAVDARSERTLIVDDAADALQESLETMHDMIIALSRLVTGEHVDRAAHVRRQADGTYARGMHARRTLLADAILGPSETA